MQGYTLLDSFLTFTFFCLQYLFHLFNKNGDENKRREKKKIHRKKKLNEKIFVINHKNTCHIKTKEKYIFLLFSFTKKINHIIQLLKTISFAKTSK